MPKKLYLAIITLTILVVAAVAAFYALQPPPQTSSAVASGLKAGDTFTYSMIGIAELGNENVTIPDNFKEVNMTDYYRVTVTSVDGPNVQFNVTWSFTNGTVYDRTGKVNVETGVDSQEFWAIYAANLTKGSPVRPAVTSGATVNDTQTRTYRNGDRQTNILQMQGEFYNTEDLTYSQICNEYTYVYFDSQTGMLVELKDMKVYSDPQIILTVEWKLIDSNVLQVS
jgi:hypothetical protein